MTSLSDGSSLLLAPTLLRELLSAYKSPPSLVEGGREWPRLRDWAPPPAGGGGWGRFLLTRSVEQGHNLSVSRRLVLQLEVREDQAKSDQSS